MGQTQFKIYVMALRSCAGIFAAAGMALYVVILAKVADKRFPATAIGLTVLPLGAASSSVAWNVLALATMTILKPIWHVFGDSLVAIILAVLGSIGFYHDSHTYLMNAMYKTYDNDAWLSQEIAGGCFLLLSFLLQLLLVLINVVEIRRLKRAKHNGPPVAYNDKGEAYTTDQKVLNIEVDWKSVKSESSASSIEKPKAIKV